MSALISGTYLDIGTGVLNSYPLTMACWFYSTNNPGSTQNPIIFALGGGDGDSVRLRLNGNGSQIALDQSTNGGALVSAPAISGYSAGLWYHVCGIVSSVTSRQCFMNGVSGALNGSSRVLDNLQHINIGNATTGIPNILTTPVFSGYIAEAAIWNTALSTGEIQSLAQGFSPQLVSPGSLKFYMPMINGYQDIRGNLGLTGTASFFRSHVKVYGP